MSIQGLTALIIEKRTKKDRCRNRAGPSSKTGNPLSAKEDTVAASKNTAEAPAETEVQVVKEYPAQVPQRPSDWDHPNLGWTVQHSTAYENTDGIPGQVFVPEQLPNPDLQRTVNVDPAAHNAGLVVLSREEAAQHPGGPEPHDPLAGTAVYPGTAAAATRTAPQA